MSRLWCNAWCNDKSAIKSNSEWQFQQNYKKYLHQRRKNTASLMWPELFVLMINRRAFWSFLSTTGEMKLYFPLRRLPLPFSVFHPSPNSLFLFFSIYHSVSTGRFLLLFVSIFLSPVSISFPNFFFPFYLPPSHSLSLLHGWMTAWVGWCNDVWMDGWSCYNVYSCRKRVCEQGSERLKQPPSG